MSNHINQLYVGEGDSWSLKKQIAVYLGLSGSGYYHIAEAIKDLNAIDSFSGWDRKMIESLRIKNSRFDGLITRLIREKVVKYSLYDHMAGASCICASNIDEFFDERFLFPHLRASLQKYVHYQVEQLYRRIFKLKDHESIIPHALQIVVDRSVKNKEELEALKKSLLFKKYMTKYTH